MRGLGIGILLLLMLSTRVWAADSAEVCTWPLWSAFKNHYLEDGRIVDNSEGRSITTSEGQSYALFFALVANDRKTFKALLNWTEQHLAGGDLSAQLPAWLWRGEVQDANAAADSDLWIAYTLSEAGRLWNEHRYATLGYLLGRRILAEETVFIPSLGLSLLPGPKGFDLGEGRYRLNPSYVPPQVLAGMASRYPQLQWRDLQRGSEALLQASSKDGWVADWVLASSQGIGVDSKTGPIGSYDAIRTYLWAGMLAPSELATGLQQRFQPMTVYLRENGVPPRRVDTRNNRPEGRGSHGFSAALLPLLVAQGQKDLAATQYERVLEAFGDQRYYDSVLSLFGAGWYEGRYRFSGDGRLQVKRPDNCSE